MTLTVILGLLAAACSAVESPAPSADAVTTATDAARRVEDGVLRIGLISPSGGEAARLGLSAQRAAQAAKTDIIGAGGVADITVEILSRDEGALGEVDVAENSVGQLLDIGVDVIVGPFSSKTMLAVLPRIVKEGVAVCSPAATSIKLSEYPDQGLLFRTIADDRVQAEAIAKLLEGSGRSSVVIAHVDDIYGRDFAAALAKSAKRRDLAVSKIFPFASDGTGVDTTAGQMLAEQGAALAIIGDTGGGMSMLTATLRKSIDAPRDIVVNDALYRQIPADQRGSLTPGSLAGLSGTVYTLDASAAFVDVLDNESATTESTESTEFASEVYDCITLAALGAAATHSTDGATLAAAIPALSTNGTACSSYADCGDPLARNIDYNGPDSLLQIDSGGERSREEFAVFKFDELGSPFIPLDGTILTIG